MRQRSAIHANDQIMGGCKLCHGRVIGAIALVDPVGHIERRLSPIRRNQTINSAAELPPSTS